MNDIKLLGKVFITGEIIVKTGLRIGGTTTGLKIGGIDQPVITDALGRPYIPGSSLKGKLRSLIEKKEGVVLNKKDRNDKPIAHECEGYPCAICKIWGRLGKESGENVVSLTRIIVRDTYLDETSITEEMRKNMELRYTEVKVETAINRSTGTALAQSLRTLERVPAGAVFRPMEIIYNVYEKEDIDILVKVFEAMELLEHDYLGGMGSRGYGKVEFGNITIYWNEKKDYETGSTNAKKINDEYTTPSAVVKNFQNIFQNIKNNIK